MRKKLTRTGNSLALVLDRPLLEQLGIDDRTTLEVSTDGRVLIVAPIRGAKRDARFRQAVERAHREFAGAFRILAK